MIEKHGWSAFAGTALDEELRAREISTIVTGGLATTFGIESTARSAYDLGYDVVVLTDAISDPAPDQHELALARRFPRWHAWRVPKRSSPGSVDGAVAGCLRRHRRANPPCIQVQAMEVPARPRDRRLRRPDDVEASAQSSGKWQAANCPGAPRASPAPRPRSGPGRSGSGSGTGTRGGCSGEGCRRRARGRRTPCRGRSAAPSPAAPACRGGRARRRPRRSRRTRRSCRGT